MADQNHLHFFLPSPWQRVASPVAKRPFWRRIPKFRRLLSKKLIFNSRFPQRESCEPASRGPFPLRQSAEARCKLSRWRARGLRFTPARWCSRSEEHTSELQSHNDVVCCLLLE